jgi:hypothetical protein
MAPIVGLTERRFNGSKRGIWAYSSCILKGVSHGFGGAMGAFPLIQAPKIPFFGGKSHDLMAPMEGLKERQRETSKGTT